MNLASEYFISVLFLPEAGERNSWSKINHSPYYFYILAQFFIYLKQCSYSLNYLINFLNFSFYILCIDYRKGTLIVMYFYVAQC